MNPNAGEFQPEFPPPPGGVAAPSPAAHVAPVAAKGAWGKGPPAVASAPSPAK